MGKIVELHPEKYKKPFLIERCYMVFMHKNSCRQMDINLSIRELMHSVIADIEDNQNLKYSEWLRRNNTVALKLRIEMVPLDD